MTPPGAANVEKQECKFGNKAAARYIGVTETTLNAWIARGIVRLAAAAPGSGNVREYSELELIRLRLMKLLADRGIELGLAFQIVQLVDIARTSVDTYLDARTSHRPWIVTRPAEAGEPERIKGFPDIKKVSGNWFVIVMDNCRGGNKMHNSFADTIAALGGNAVVVDVARFVRDAELKLSEL
jgi:DNA-binding transcriptional MerR regulator